MSRRKNRQRLAKVPSDEVVTPKQEARVNNVLETPMLTAYRPSLPIYSMREQTVLGIEFFQDIEVMRVHDSVRLPMSWCMSAIRMPEWNIKATSLEVAKYASDLLMWFWTHALPKVQEEGYTYGWCASELVYCERDGLIYLDEIIPFSARDVMPVVDPATRVASGVLINGALSGQRGLWGFRKTVPNKAFWYAHRLRFQGFYGDSQCRPAWKPWRSLAGIDGQEEIIALANHRFGTGIVKVYHPEGNYTGTTLNTPGYNINGIVSNSDIARQVAENLKTGAGIALSSEPYPAGAGGGKRWDVVVDSFNTNIEQLLAGEARLYEKVSKAIGVPPELIQAAETGSGYSGRAIPLQGFLSAQQTPLNDMTTQVVKQIIKPLIYWCFGPDETVDITAKPLVKSFRKMAYDEGDTAGGNGQSMGDAASSAGQPPFNEGSVTAGQPQG